MHNEGAQASPSRGFGSCLFFSILYSIFGFTIPLAPLQWLTQTMRSTPVDRFIIERLLQEGRINNTLLRELSRSTEVVSGRLSIVDLMVERGIMETDERGRLSESHRRFNQMLESSGLSVERQDDADSLDPAQPTPGLEEPRRKEPPPSRNPMAATISRHIRPDLAATMMEPRDAYLGGGGDDPADFERTNRLNPVGPPDEFESTSRMLPKDLPGDFERTSRMNPAEASKPIPIIGDAPEHAPTIEQRRDLAATMRVRPEDLDLPTPPQTRAWRDSVEELDDELDLPEGASEDDIRDFESADTLRPGQVPLMLSELDRTAKELYGEITRREQEVVAPTTAQVPPPLVQAPPEPLAATQADFGDDLAATQPSSENLATPQLPRPALAPSLASHSEVTQPSAAPVSAVAHGASGIRSAGGSSVDALASLRSISQEMRAGSLDLSRLLTPEEMERMEGARKRHRSSTSMIGEVMGAHVVIDKIGAGGMGEVFLAKQVSLGRMVALKVLPDAFSHDPEQATQFVYEANLLARINHTSIVQIYDVAVADDGRIYFTMELVKGRTLRQLIEEQGTVPLELALNVTRQCSRALARVKKVGITHRDVKPGNILVDEQGVAKLVDFGLADQTSILQERAGGHTAGTPMYMPPEAIRNEPATHLSDQYALGATLYHMIAGQPPFPATSLAELAKKHLEAPVPAASTQNSLVPPALDKIVQRMMAKNPADRFPSFRALFEALEAVEMQLGLRRDHEQFASEQLVNLATRGIANIKRKVALWASIGFAACYTAIGAWALTVQSLGVGDSAYLLDVAGNLGTYLIVLSYIIILYIGAVRKRMLPPWGSIQRWLQVHMGMAFAGSMLVIYHSGNFLRDYLLLTPADRLYVLPVALIPMLNTLILMLVVVSGLVGRFIYRDLNRQMALERIGLSAGDADESMSPHTMTMLVVSHRLLGFWRVLHYPLTILFFLLTFLHVITVMYYGGSFFSIHPDSVLMEGLR